jgi:hypothetical protein
MLLEAGRPGGGLNCAALWRGWRHWGWESLVKTCLFPLATLAFLVGGGCTRSNPAFLGASPASEREPEQKRDAARAPDPVADAGPPLTDAPVAADVMAADAVAEAAAPPDAPADDAASGEDAGGGAGDAGPVDASAPDSSLSIGMVVRYPLDIVGSADVPDVSLTRPGAMHGGASWTNVGFPGAQFANGGALVLDGSSGYVTLPAAGLPTVGATKSISLWFWQVAPINALRKTLLAISNPDESSGLMVGLQGGVPSVWFWRQLIGTAIVAGPRSSPAGWTHLVFVQQGNTHRLYVNGSLADSSSVTLPRSAAVTSFLLGGYDANGGEDERWNGRLDDVRIYNRPLTAPEISALAAGSP